MRSKCPFQPLTFLELFKVRLPISSTRHVGWSNPFTSIDSMTSNVHLLFCHYPTSYIKQVLIDKYVTLTTKILKIQIAFVGFSLFLFTICTKWAEGAFYSLCKYRLFWLNNVVLHITTLPTFFKGNYNMIRNKKEEI